MHLKRLELFGFKTFPDRTVLDFNEPTGIAAIVGPNGCGKSNIIDAFRWVMGEQSIKLLRGTSQDEIIFAGTEDRKPVSLAEVILTIDNSDRKMNIDYTEVQIGRRYYRTGESEYLINKQVVRLKDVQELLMDTGIGKGSYAIIGQGQVIEILHSKPEDRRGLFEEAAGINKYKTRKILTQRKLQSAEQNLTRLKDIRAEIHQQLGPLEEQARVAQEYQVLKKDLAGMEIGMFKVKVGKINDFKTVVEKAIGEYQTIVAEADAKAESITSKKQEIREKIVAIDARLKELNELLKNTQIESSQANNRIKVTEERINNHAQRVHSLEQELITLRNNKESLTVRLQETEIELDASQRAVSEYTDKLEKKNAETKGIFDRWQSINQEIATIKKVVQQFVNQIEIKKSKMLGLESSERVIIADQQHIATTLANVSQEQEELTVRATELTERKEYVDQKITELRIQRDTSFKHKADTEEERKKLISQRSEIKSQFDSKSSRLHLLEEMQASHEGFQKGVRSIFQAKKQEQSFNGVRGVIADLITVPKEYESAIEAALENNLQAVVSSDLATVKNVISYLKDRALGKSSFIPADALSSYNKPNITTTLASEVVTYESQYTAVVQTLLGSVAIVDSLEDALERRAALIAAGIKAIVTVGGEFISASGIITGGSTGKETSSLLGRQREVIELRQAIGEYKEQLEQLDKRTKELEQLFIELDNQLKNSGNELKTLEIEQGTVTNDLARIRIDSEKFIRQIENSTKDKTENEQELARIAQEKQNVQIELSDLTSQKTTQDTLLTNKEQELEQANREKDSVNELLTEIKISSTNAEGTRRQIELKLESFTESLKVTTLQIEQKEQEIVRINKEKTDSAAAIEQLTIQAPIMQEQIEKLETEITEQQTESKRFFNDLEVYDRMDQERSQGDREVRHKLAEEEIKHARIDAEFSEISRRLTNDYGLTIDDVLASDAVVENYEKTEEEVEKLRRRIKRMEPVNLLAIEEYDAQKERLAFIEKQCEDLDRASLDLQNIIKELDVQAITAFKEAFDLVNTHFRNIFMELFKGGEAELRIVDETNILESGVEIYAKVPGTKRAQSMTLMSGGQKALTAIALLFSLMTARPGPFCILDEIDAELDDINISRVTEILRKYSQETQIIIITHRQPTMAIVNTMFGLTMEQRGISKVISVKLNREKKPEAVEA